MRAAMVENPARRSSPSDGIASSGHDAGSIVGMNGALIFSHRDIFDVVRAVFYSPVSSFQREDAQRRERWWQADWSLRSGPTHAIRLWLDSLGGSQTRGS